MCVGYGLTAVHVHAVRQAGSCLRATEDVGCAGWPAGVVRESMARGIACGHTARQRSSTGSAVVRRCCGRFAENLCVLVLGGGVASCVLGPDSFSVNVQRGRRSRSGRCVASSSVCDIA